jgi:hypothetical protein
VSLRFRKSIKLAPGVRLNFSGSGTSWTFGPRGASIGVGSRGTYLNTGIPGTGLFSRTRLSGGESSHALSSSRTSSAPPEGSKVEMTCSPNDDGVMTFRDANGDPVSERIVEIAKKQNREAIQGLIQTKCDQINEHVEVLGRLHLNTPDPKVRPQFLAPTFDEMQPESPVAKVPGFFDKLFSSRKLRIEEENRAAEQSFQESHADWQMKLDEFHTQVIARKNLVEVLIYKDVPAMEKFLEESLHDIAWPRETKVDFDIDDEGRTVRLDVDLPELEDMPNKLAAVPVRGLKLSVKGLAPAKVQKLYGEHIHSLAFRLVGEVFAALPVAQLVELSGYSQRRSKVTGQMGDEYLLSVRVERPTWESIDFHGMKAIDVNEALAQFDLKRDQLKDGAFKAIIPHTVHVGGS